jgi:hypothetical protein
MRAQSKRQSFAPIEKCRPRLSSVTWRTLRPLRSVRTKRCVKYDSPVLLLCVRTRRMYMQRKHRAQSRAHRDTTKILWHYITTCRTGIKENRYLSL